MSNPPKLTRGRWMSLKAIRDNPVLQRRDFLAAELQRELVGGRMAGGSGATLHSLRQAGWVERIEIPATKDGPFWVSGAASAWRLTDAGREAIAALPENPPPRD